MMPMFLVVTLAMPRIVGNPVNLQNRCKKEKIEDSVNNGNDKYR
jgi:hypothetical protein